jgi:hypothetical protein
MFPCTDFTYDAERDIYLCPKRQTFAKHALRSVPSSSRCQRDMSLRISPTLNFPSPDAQVPPRWA